MSLFIRVQGDKGKDDSIVVAVLRTLWKTLSRRVQSSSPKPNSFEINIPSQVLKQELTD